MVYGHHKGADKLYIVDARNKKKKKKKKKEMHK